MKKHFMLLNSIIVVVALSIVSLPAQILEDCLGCGKTSAVRGIKFEDQNGNGVRDGGEPPVPGVQIHLNGPTGSSYPPLGMLKATFILPPGGGLAFDGQYLYHTVGPAFIQKTTTSGTVVSTFNVARPIGALTWDCRGKHLWAASGDAPAEIWGVNPSTGQMIPGTAFQLPAGTNPLIDGLQYDTRDATLWYSVDAAQTIYHITLTGSILGSFPSPHQSPQIGNSGIGFDGNNLWLVLVGFASSRVMKVTDTGAPLVYFDVPGRAEDIEFDCITFAPDNVLWVIYAYAAGPGIFAYEVSAYSISNSSPSVTTTNANGFYTFVRMPPGNYTVTEFALPNWLQTAPPSGSHAITTSAGQVVANLDFGNKKNAWQKLMIGGVLRGADDPINIALNRARTEIAGSDIGPDVEKWYAQLNEKDWVTHLTRDPKRRALATRLVEIGRRMIEKNGKLRRADIPVIEEALHSLERGVTPAPRGLIPKVMGRLQRSVGRKWPEVTKNLTGKSSIR